MGVSIRVLVAAISLASSGLARAGGAAQRASAPGSTARTDSEADACDGHGPEARACSAPDASGSSPGAEAEAGDGHGSGARATSSDASGSAPRAEAPHAGATSAAGASSAGSDAAADPIAERLKALEDKQKETGDGLLSLKRLHFSGYVQARMLYAENSQDGLNASGSPAVRDGFMVRRGRLKATYDANWSKLVLQIDATGRGIGLRDAEVHLIEPWTGYRLELVVGQMKWPFGYEVLQSSSERELPERSRVVRAFAPGERDRGAKFAGKVGPTRFAVGVFDGDGIDLRGFSGVDNDREKDVIGRLGLDFGWIAGGVSGWLGKTYSAEQRRYFDRNRVGADLQVSFKALPFGATALQGEYIAGHTYAVDGLEQFGVPANGWWTALIQNVGERDAAALRFDYFDPSAGTRASADAKDPGRPAATNPVGTFGFGLVHRFDEALKASAFYEIPLTRTPGGTHDPEDNLLTVQFQASF